MDIVITITRKPNGQILVNGPLPDKLLCYGMLEQARDVVKDFKVEPGIIAAGVGDLPVGG